MKKTYFLLLTILCLITVGVLPKTSLAAPNYVPVRNVFESLDGTITSGESKITIELPNAKIELRPNQVQASKAGENLELHQPIIMENGKAYIHVLDVYKLAKDNNKEKHYRVQKGDTLSEIARVTGVTVSELIKWNHLQSDSLQVGQHLHTVDPVYTVKAGDSLWEIAQNNETTVDALKEANQLTMDFLLPGQNLYIPVQPSMSPPDRFTAGYFPLLSGTYMTYGNDFDSTREHTGTDKASIHEGIDILASEWAPVFAASAGKLTDIGWNDAGGWQLKITTPVGITMFYAHLNGYPEGLKMGQTISRGQLIGFVGDTGNGPKGTKGKYASHLHFGMYDTNTTPQTALNPYYYLKWWEMRP